MSDEHIIKIPSTQEQVILKSAGDAVCICPSDTFDYSDSRNLVGLATVIGRIQDGTLRLPASMTSAKRAFVSVPGGAIEEAVEQQAPQLATTQQLEAVAGKVSQIEQMLSQVVQQLQPQQQAPQPQPQAQPQASPQASPQQPPPPPDQGAQPKAASSPLVDDYVSPLLKD